MSEHSTPEERTEMPTAKRWSQLRKEGQVHMSTEVVTVSSLMAGFGIMLFVWPYFLADMKFCMVAAFSAIAKQEPLTQERLFTGMFGLLKLFGPDIMAVAVFIATIATLAVMLQTKWNVKKKKIDMKWNFINPVNGVKKIISPQGFSNTFKAVVKLCIMLPIGYLALEGFAPMMIQLIHSSVEDIMAFTGLAIWKVFWKMMYLLIALAIIDYFWTKFLWYRQNKMTKQEVKDERKAQEGDEATKRKIQAKGLQRIMERIRDSVPQADVVITNPTHYAVALKYDRDTMSAPQVVAKGRGFIAQRIKAIAKENDVPVLERKALARALYSSAEVGAEIPYELFKAVAEVLAYVYRLKNPYKYQQAMR